MNVRTGLLASASLLVLAGAAMANPQGLTVVSGAATAVQPSAGTLLVNQGSTNAILNWTGFSVGAGEKTTFAVPTDGATLNRVTGGNLSEIYGSLSSNGRFFLVNPAGIVVGATGVIDTAGLVLSTHDLSDAEFLARKDMNFRGTSSAAIVNLGTIRSTGGGDVFLIARDVRNEGTISAPGGTVGLVGGTDVLIRATDTGDGRVMVRAGSGSVTNKGVVEAAVAELRAAGGNHYALAVNNSGVVRATGVVNRGGRVYLSANTGAVSHSGRIVAVNHDGSGGKVRISAGVAKAGTAATRGSVDITGDVSVAGTDGVGGSIVVEANAITLGGRARLDASGTVGGGSIAVGGGFRGADASIFNADEVSVAAGAVLKADATTQGDGGRVVLWSDGATTFAGLIEATGGATGGDGGTAEVSGAHLAYLGSADLRAPAGTVGSLLLDPGRLDIVHGASGVDTIGDSDLQTQLGTASVTLATSTSTGANGATEDIVIGSGVRVVWNGATLLTLQAGHDITALSDVIIQNTQTGDGVNSYVMKNAGGVLFEAGNDIRIGSATATAAVAIGSEFGISTFVAGDADFDGRPDVAGTGSVIVAGGSTTGASAQLGYVQPERRGANTGNDYSSAGVHAANGDITVYAGKDVTLTGGSATDTFVQIGHGGAAVATAGDATRSVAADIAASDIVVVSKGGSVKLDSQGVESGWAQIGHGSNFDLAGVSQYAAGNVSGNTFVDALTSIVLNDTTTPASGPGGVAGNGATDVFSARIGSGAHLTLKTDSGSITTGAIDGAIGLGSWLYEDPGVKPATPLGRVVLGSATTPALTDDAREVFSQIGHGASVRLAPGTGGGTTTVSLGAVETYRDIATVSYGTSVSVAAEKVAIDSIIAAPANSAANTERGQIGSGNHVRLQAGAASQARTVVDGTAVVTGVAPSVDGKPLSALTTMTAAEVAALDDTQKAALAAFVASHTTNTSTVTSGATTGSHYSLVLTEGNLTGDVLVRTLSDAGAGIALTADINAGLYGVDRNTALARIGHGSFVQLIAANGADAVAGVSAAVAGGDITYSEANVLFSKIVVSTGKKDDIVVKASTEAGLAAVTGGTLSAAIGSGSDITLATGRGGAGAGVAGTSAYAGATGGDIVFHRGTVWDGSDTGSLGYTAYDTGIAVVSANDLKVTTSATAALAAASGNTVLGRIGHGSVITLTTGSGGEGATGTDGGRGGDVHVDQQTPGRSYGGTLGDLAWGLRGLVEIGADDAGATAVTVSSNVTAALAAASNNTSSARVGHGDHLYVSTGNGGRGGARGNDTLVATAAGARGGHADIDLSRTLIEGSITNAVSGITGGVLVDAETTDALAASQHNLSDVAIGHGENIVARTGMGGAGGNGSYLTNGVTVSDGAAIADTFLVAQGAVGAARGGNGGDVRILFGAITDRRQDGNAFVHDRNADVALTITGADAAFRSLVVNASINPGVANGPGDEVAAIVGHSSRAIALTGAGGNGGNGSATFDRGLDAAVALGAATGLQIQNDASGGRGGDARILLGNHADASGNAYNAGVPLNTLVIGTVQIAADEKVVVTSNAGPGSFSRAESSIGHWTDVVALTQNGGDGGDLYGTGGMPAGSGVSGAEDGILASPVASNIQIIVYRDGTKGVSLTGSGVADSIQSVAARRTGAVGSATFPIFFDRQGNPEYILDGSGNLVPNTGTNTTNYAALASNVARFGRTVAGYDAGIGMDNVQYVDLNNDGKADVYAASLNRTASMLSVVDVDKDNVYDQISGRVRLADGSLGNDTALLDYARVTGKAPAFSGNADGWTLADFATSNGGRGGDASVVTGTVTTYAAAPLVRVNAGLVNAGAVDFETVVSSTMQATPPSADTSNIAAARIGVSEYLLAETDASYSQRLSGAEFVVGRGTPGAGGTGGVNAVNASGGRGGNATVWNGAVTGDVILGDLANAAAGIETRAFTDDVTSENISLAQIGHGGFTAASAANRGGNGKSVVVTRSTIDEVADGGAGGTASLTVAARTGNVTLHAGDNPLSPDFSLVVEAVKGGSTAVGDSRDVTVADIGHGSIVRALGGNGGNGDQGQYRASGGAGGDALITVATATGKVTLDALSKADIAGGNGIRIESSTSEGSLQVVRSQAGHWSMALATAGAGGNGTTDSDIVEQRNQTADGGTGGAARIVSGGYVGDIALDAGAVLSGTDAILVKSTDNTVNSGSGNMLLAGVGHGGYADATAGNGGAGGQRNARGGLTLEADPAFYEGFDVADTAAGASAPLDRNPIMLGTIRNGGAGGAASVDMGPVSGRITVTAHDLATAGFDGIHVVSKTGDGDNMSSALYGDVAAIGVTGFARATGGRGGDSISSTLAATVTSGNGGDGGAGTVAFGAVSGDIVVTNVVANEANASGSSKDTDVLIETANQDAQDAPTHRSIATVGNRLIADAFGGAGGNALVPPPGPLYSATVSAQGGIGGDAGVTFAAIASTIAVTAENAVVLKADGGTPASPRLLSQIGSHTVAQTVRAGAGGYGGDEASFDDYAMFQALRRYVDLGQPSSLAGLSDMEKLLVAPVLHYYRGALPSTFVARVLAGDAALTQVGANWVATFARDDDAIAGTNNFVPTLSSDEKDALIALSMASGHGGRATTVQNGITGDLTVKAYSADTTDASRGIRVLTSATLNSGTQIALIGNEQEVSAVTGGKGQDLRGGTIADGISGDGGSVSVVQRAISGAISLTAGDTPLATSGDIFVEAKGSLTGGWQRSLIGNRQMVGDDDPNHRTAPVLRAGDAGMDQDPLANGRLGNGGSVTVSQETISGAIGLVALGTSPSGTAITVRTEQALTSGEALATVGHAMIIDSIKAGDAQPYATVDARKSLYGVSEGNGGSISILQGDIAQAILLDANDALLVQAMTATASGTARTVIGNEQIVADTRYGRKNGSVVAGQGVDVLSEEDVDTATGAPGFTDTIHASLGGSVADGDGGNVLIAQGVLSGDVTLQSRRQNTDVLAVGSQGITDIWIGQQRSVTAVTGEGGVQAGTQPRGEGEGGTAVLTRGAISGDVLIQSLAATRTTTVKATAALGSEAAIYGGHSATYSVTTGRSGYGSDVFSTLDTLLATFVAQPAPTAGVGTAGEATTRDAARAIHTMEDVVAALTFANRYAAHYSPAQQADLAKALTDATTALATARAAVGGTGTAISRATAIQAAAAASKAALGLGHATVTAGGNASGIASAADAGSIVYTAANPIVAGTTVNEGLVSGDVTVRTAPPASGSTWGAGTVAIQSEGGDGRVALVELGHRHTITNTTGVGGGYTVGSPQDGGVAGDGGSITVSQTTSGNVTLQADRVVVNPTAGSAGKADVHLLHDVSLVDNAGKSDIEALLGHGGDITATQTTTGTASIVANALSSSPTGAADGLLEADGGSGNAHLRIGIEATAAHASDSDETIGGKGGGDADRGGRIVAAQGVTSGFVLNLDLNGTGHVADVDVKAVGLGQKDVRIGALVSQTARSGNPVDDGSDVTVTQTVAGDTLTSAIEDLKIENVGAGAAQVVVGHQATQVADSGETAGLTGQQGGITTATQTVSGRIVLSTTRSYTQETDATATGLNRVGHSGAQIARSADQRTGASTNDWPIVPGAGTQSNFNVVSNQTIGGDLTITSGEITIKSLDGVNSIAQNGVQLGNVARITVDTDTDGRVSSKSTVGGKIGLTTVAAAAERDTTITAPAVVGDITVRSDTAAGGVHVGHVSISQVSHDPAAYQPTGVFVTDQTIGTRTDTKADAITVTALHNVTVAESVAGTARIGDYITEDGHLHTTDAVKTSSADPSTVAQTVAADIDVTAGNSLVMTTNGGTAQIGHFSPASDDWQVTGGRVVTPQSLTGDVTVKVGLDGSTLVAGETPTAAAPGSSNALLDGSAGGTVRVGHQFAPVTGAAANQVDTAAGNVRVEVGAHLVVKTAKIGHGPYDTASAAVSTTDAVAGLGTVRNRITGLTTIGALQNRTASQDATTEKDGMVLDGATLNSGYGDNGGQLRFFVPSRQNLTIVAPVVMNDSASKTDALADRSASKDYIVSGAGTDHENGFTAMSTTARYVDVGAGNYAFYFSKPSTPVLSQPATGSEQSVLYLWDEPHRGGDFHTPCVGSTGGGVSTGATGGARGLAWASSFGSNGGGNGSSCGTGTGTGPSASLGTSGTTVTATFGERTTRVAVAPMTPPSLLVAARPEPVVVPAERPIPSEGSGLATVRIGAPVSGSLVPGERVSLIQPDVLANGRHVLSRAYGGVDLMNVR